MKDASYFSSYKWPESVAVRVDYKLNVAAINCLLSSLLPVLE